MTLDNKIIGTAVDYFANVKDCDSDDIPVDWDETGDPNLISLKEFNLVGEIIASQVSFWALRRMYNSCQSNCDYMQTIMRNKIKEYEDQFGEFKNYNSKSIW